MKRLMLLAALVTLPLAGCASEGVRVAPDVEAVQTQEFNPTDLQIISKKAVEDLLARNIFPQGVIPAVYVPMTRNLTNEHVNVQIIQEYVGSLISNSGKVRLVEYPKGFEEAKSQLEFQQGRFVNPETAKSVGRMIGADYFIMGELNSLPTTAGWKKGQFFMFTLTLVKVDTLESWKSIPVEIQKVAKRGLFGW